MIATGNSPSNAKKIETDGFSSASAGGASSAFAAARAASSSLVRPLFMSASLSDEERLAATWGVWGTTLYSADLRAAVGSPFILQIKKPPDVPDELQKVIASSEF